MTHHLQYQQVVAFDKISTHQPSHIRVANASNYREIWVWYGLMEKCNPIHMIYLLHSQSLNNAHFKWIINYLKDLARKWTWRNVRAFCDFCCKIANKNVSFVNQPKEFVSNANVCFIDLTGAGAFLFDLFSNEFNLSKSDGLKLFISSFNMHSQRRHFTFRQTVRLTVIAHLTNYSYSNIISLECNPLTNRLIAFYLHKYYNCLDRLNGNVINKQ